VVHKDESGGTGSVDLVFQTFVQVAACLRMEATLLRNRTALGVDGALKRHLLSLSMLKNPAYAGAFDIVLRGPIPGRTCPLKHVIAASTNGRKPGIRVE